MGVRARLVVLAASAVAVVAGGLGVAPALTQTGAVRVIPGNIAHAATCDPSLPDVSAQLQAWLDSLPNRSVAQLGANQCYHSEYPITIGAKTNVIFDGNGSTLAAFTDGCDGRRIGTQHFVKCKYPAPADASAPIRDDWPQSRYHVRLEGNKYLTVENLHIEGGKTRPGYDLDYAFQNGIEITGTADGTVLDNVTVDHVWGDFVHFSEHVRRRTTPQHVTIEHSHFGLDRPFMGSGRQGIDIGEGAYLYVHDNVIQYSSRSAVDIEPTSSGALLREIYFDHNVFGPHGNNLFADHSYGKADPVVDGIYFRYNELDGTGLQVDSVVPDLSKITARDAATYNRHNYQFIGNRSDTQIAKGGCPGTTHTDWAMRLWGIDGIVIQDNVQPVGKDRCMALFDAAKVAHLRATGNTVKYAVSTAVRYYQSYDVCEANNRVGNPVSLTATPARTALDSTFRAPACPA
jgi:hypothetical protein